MSERTAVAARRRDPDARPDQILDAAAALLVAEGPAALTMERVARDAGLAKGTPYLYFPSKTELVVALRTRQVRRMLDRCEAATRDAGSAAEALDLFLTAGFAATLADAPLLRQLFHAGGTPQTEVAMTRDALRAHIEAGIAAEEFAPADAEVAATFLVHGMRGVFAEALHAPDERRAEAVAAVRVMAAAILVTRR
jgi:AcrR family transcriptional regulator